MRDTAERPTSTEPEGGKVTRMSGTKSTWLADESRLNNLGQAFPDENPIPCPRSRVNDPLSVPATGMTRDAPDPTGC